MFMYVQKRSDALFLFEVFGYLNCRMGVRSDDYKLGCDEMYGSDYYFPPSE